jgi:NAD(P)-dependent dehydrogenase (short-subunit alcohol dehydrogenase family)
MGIPGWSRRRADRNGTNDGPGARSRRHRGQGGRARTHQDTGDEWSPPEEFADVASHQALSRPLTPVETEAVLTMLTRGDAAELTGQTLTVDGGIGISVSSC